MKEIPLLFSGDMVRAERAGRKTQMRRLCKPMNAWVVRDGREVRTIDGRHFHFLPGATAPIEELHCPYGRPGDRLWVRESWRVSAKHDGTRASALPFDRGMTIMYDAGGSRAHDHTGSYVNDDHYPPTLPDWAGKLRPSIFLPRAACRTLLDIVSVRVERLHEITYEDSLAEGVSDYAAAITEGVNAIGETPEQTARRLEWPQRQYRLLWDSLNAARGFGWDTNPWVWVIDFKRADDVAMQDAA